MAMRSVFQVVLLLNIVLTVTLFGESVEDELEALEQEMREYAESKKDKPAEESNNVILTPVIVEQPSVSEDNSEEMKRKKLELKAKELELKEREIEIERQKQQASQPTTKQVTAYTTYPVAKPVKKIEQRDGGIYLAYSYGSGGLEYTVSNDIDEYEYESADSFDIGTQSFKIGFGGFRENRVEWSYNIYDIDESFDTDSRWGIGYNYIFTGNGERFNPYLSIGIEYVQIDYDGRTDAEGEEKSTGFGANVALGFYVKIFDALDLGMGYQYKTHMFSWEYETMDSSFNRTTVVESRDDIIQSLTADIIIRF